MNALLLVLVLAAAGPGSVATQGAGSKAPGDAGEALEHPPRPALPAFTDQERATLAAGETVYRPASSGEEGLAARVVEAPPEAIWGVVLDYDAYVEWLPYVTTSETQGTERGDHCRVHQARLELTTKGVVTRYGLVSWAHPDERYVVFASDSPGPVKGGDGSWLLEPWGVAAWLLVYRVEVDTAWWVPWFTKRYAQKRGLPAVVELVAERAEGRG